ncbi:hypothetical protein ABH927_005093 [Planotetraspora sp. GP83]
MRGDRLRWYLSRLRTEPVSEDICVSAIDLLRAAQLHGQKYAIDAVVAFNCSVVVQRGGGDGMLDGRRSRGDQR